jgi:hypothetical protein
MEPTVWSLLVAPNAHALAVLPDLALVALNHHHLDVCWRQLNRI